MVFSSFVFLFRFLPVFLMIYFIAPEKFRNLVLFAGSIAFYTYGEAAYVLLLLASVVIERRRQEDHDQLALFPTLAANEPGDARVAVYVSLGQAF